MEHNYYSIKFRKGAFVRFKYLYLTFVLAFIAIPPLQGMAADSYLSNDPQLYETDGSEVAQRTIFGGIKVRNEDQLPGMMIFLMVTIMEIVSDADGYV